MCSTVMCMTSSRSLSATVTYPTLNGPFVRPGQVDGMMQTLWTIEARPIGNAWVLFAHRSGERPSRPAVLGVTSSWELVRRVLAGERLTEKMACWQRLKSDLLRHATAGFDFDNTMRIWDGSLGEGITEAVGPVLLADGPGRVILIPAYNRMVEVRPGDGLVVENNYLTVIPHELIM